MWTRDTASTAGRSEGWSTSTIVGLVVGLLALTVAVPSAVLAVMKLRRARTGTRSGAVALDVLPDFIIRC